jgi:hypothetical protein
VTYLPTEPGVDVLDRARVGQCSVDCAYDVARMPHNHPGLVGADTDLVARHLPLST